MDLGERKKRILHAIINDYIETAEPVGSRTIAKKYLTDISPATIRNEMADLEDLGLLEQPHTSAGRIPSDKGYRYYVDEIMEVKYPTPQEIERIKYMLQITTINEIDKIIKRTTKLLSDVTKYTSAVLTPSMKKSFIKSLQLIKVTDTDVVAVVVTDTGIIKNVVIKTPKKVTDSTIQKLNNILNEKLAGLSINDIGLSVISDIQNHMAEYSEIFSAVISVIYESLKEDNGEIYLDGTTNIFDYPEYDDKDRARSFLSLIENKELLAHMFSESSDNLCVSIGCENELDKAKDCSIVKATYNIADKNIGTIGIIGPKRMDYPKVVGVLKSISCILTEIFENNL